METDILRIAREVDPVTALLLDRKAPQGMDHDTFVWFLERFAALVRADEREQCARMIEGAPPLVPFAQNDQGGCLVCGFTPKLAAAAIRARSNVQQEPQK